MTTKKKCLLDYCDKPSHAKGLCWGHYDQSRTGLGFRKIVPRISSSLRDENGHKKCNRCLTFRPIDQFYFSKDCLDGLAPKCKLCARITSHGITLKIYQQRLIDQNFNCAICPQIIDEWSATIDHDHSCCNKNRGCSKCFRGLLCSPCNLALGAVRDNTNTLKAAIEYLEKFSGSSI